MVGTERMGVRPWRPAAGGHQRPTWVWFWRPGRPALAAAGPLGQAPWLGPGARARHRRMGPARAAEFVIGQALLAWGLGQLLGVPAATVRLVSRRGRAPWARWPRPARRWGLSLAHAGGVWAVAASRLGPVGVDVIEARRAVAQPARLWGALPPAERGLGGGGPAADGPALMRLWALKEAWAKASGQAIGAAWRRPLPTPGAGAGGWRLADTALACGHWLALAEHRAAGALGPPPAERVPAAALGAWRRR